MAAAATRTETSPWTKLYDNLYPSASTLNNQCEVVDDALRFAGDGVLTIATLSSANATLADMHNYAGVLRSGISLFRAGVTWCEVAGGSLCNSLSKSQFMSLILRTLLLAGRTISALLWVNKKSSFLGTHAKGMGISVSCIFTVVNGLAFVSAVRDYYAPNLQPEAYRAEKMKSLHELDREAVADLYAARRKTQAKTQVLSTFLELATSPWECGILHSNSFGASLVGAILNMISSGVKIFLHWNYFDLASEPTPAEMASGSSVSL